MKLRKLLLTCAFVLSAAALCVFCLPQQANAATESDLSFTKNPDGESYSVTGCNSSAQGALEIPATYQGKPVTVIGYSAFYSCRKLTSITVPSSVTGIERSAFSRCSSLTNITIPSSVTNIGSEAFSSCSSLTGITIPGSVNGIGSEAFKYCENLTCVTILDGVTSIDWGAFSRCSRLTSITIPDSVTRIDGEAFYNCSNLTSVTIPDGVTKLGREMFYNCSSLTGITIPDSVTRIDGGVFYNCSSLTSVTIGNSVTIIDYSAFYCCSSLTSITIPDSVTQIGDQAFYGCSSLMSVTIPAGVTDIGNDAFCDCSSLTGIWVDANNPNYSSDSFGVLFTKTQTDLIQAPGALIGAYSIPNSVTQIHEYAFYRCHSLTSVAIPDSVTSIRNHTFCRCNSLTYVTAGNGVMQIGYSAFQYCSNLMGITIPESVTRIEDYAFNGCSSLTDVYYGGTEEQWFQFIPGMANGELLMATMHYNAGIFNDVNKTSWQFPFAQYALQQNLMAGKGTDAHGRIKFDPNSPITREEFVQVLYNAEGKPTVDLLNPFPDVAENGWYKNAVLWAKANNIANGGGDGNFGIGARIIRQDLALMLYKYAQLKNYTTEKQQGITDQFGDKDSISGYAKDAMDWAVTNGILSGKGVAGQPLSTFRLDPTGTATRAECAAMLKNFMNAFGL